MIAGAFIEKNGVPIGHETSIVIILGLIISGSATFFNLTEFNESMEFNQEFFFFVLIPPIIYAAGFNMRRRKFF